jgi:hypothetical protein
MTQPQRPDFVRKNNSPYGNEEEEKVAYPGVEKVERDIAFGRTDPDKEFGLSPHGNYAPPGEF